MDRTICAKERSRHRGFSASRGRGGCVTFPRQSRRVRTAFAARARSRLAGRPLTRFHTWPRVCGVSEEQDVLTFHVNLWPGGMPPDPQDITRAPRRRPGMEPSPVCWTLAFEAHLPGGLVIQLRGVRDDFPAWTRRGHASHVPEGSCRGALPPRPPRGPAPMHARSRARGCAGMADRRPPPDGHRGD